MLYSLIYTAGANLMNETPSYSPFLQPLQFHPENTICHKAREMGESAALASTMLSGYLFPGRYSETLPRGARDPGGTGGLGTREPNLTRANFGLHICPPGVHTHRLYVFML